MANPNDGVRDLILRQLYGVHQRARGPKSVSIGIRDLQKALKSSGVKQQQVNSNLDYLIQKGWAVRVVEERSFTTPRGTRQSSQKVSYKISDVGIDRLEAASSYQRDDSYSRINITNVTGVTVVGSGNVVNTAHTDLAGVLSELERAVGASDSLEDEGRLNALADLSTIQSQLSKPKPDVGIVRSAWSTVEATVTASDLVGLVARAAAFIANLV